MQICTMIKNLLVIIFLTSLSLSFQQQLFGQCDACQYQEELVNNGDFQLGPFGYTTDYTLSLNNGPWGLLSNEGTYGISPNANFLHNNFQGFDHTNPGVGNFMVVNGAAVPNTNVWCQNIDVEPNTDYVVSGWFRNVDTNPQNNTFGNLQFQIDGVSQGNALLADGDWEQITFNWNSGASETIELCILSLQIEPGGNDFGIDDISLTTCKDYNVLGIVEAGDNFTVCSGEQFTLGSGDLINFTYEWTENGEVVSSEGTPDFVINNDGTTSEVYQYEVIADSAGTGCIQTDVVEVVVNPNPVISIGEDVIICEGESVFLNAGDEWEEVIWSTNEDTSVIWVEEAGTYSVSVTNLGCTSSDEVLVESPDLPEIDLGQNTSICEDETAVFSVTAEGVWSDGETDLDYETSTEEWVWFEVEGLGCTKRDSVYVTVINYPNVSIEEEITLCPGELYTYTIPQEGTWNNSTQSNEYQINEPGVNVVTVANEQCAIVLESEVFYLQLPEVELGGDQLLCTRDIVELDASGAYNDSVIWNDGSELFFREITMSGIYEVITWNQCGEARDEVELIFDDCGYGLYIPNTFTPDGDGLNEVWLPITLNIEEFEVFVVNRWGEEVFRTTTIGEGWNGAHQKSGYYVPDGVYSYRVKAISVKGQAITEFGHILIVR